MIVSYAERGTLASCLRVSMLFFHLAGKKLYTRIEIDHEVGWSEIMRGAVLYEVPEEESDGEDTVQPETINFKRLLLEYVETILIGHHDCDEWTSGLGELHRSLPGLKRAIVPRGGDCAPDQYYDFNVFPREDQCLLDQLRYESLTIHDCSLSTLRYSRWDPVCEVFQNIKHATLVIPPISAHDHMIYMALPGCDPDYPPRRLESLRLIFATDRT